MKKDTEYPKVIYPKRKNKRQRGLGFRVLNEFEEKLLMKVKPTQAEANTILDIGRSTGEYPNAEKLAPKEETE